MIPKTFLTASPPLTRCGAEPELVNPLRPSMVFIDVLLCVATASVQPLGDTIFNQLWENLIESVAELRSTIIAGPLTTTGNQKGGLVSLLACPYLNEPVEQVEITLCTDILEGVRVGLTLMVFTLLFLFALDLGARVNEAAIKTPEIRYSQLNDACTDSVKLEKLDDSRSFSDHDYIPLAELPSTTT